MGAESLDDTEAALAEQVAVNTDNITRIFAEQERVRDRLHTFESDRATVLLLAQKVDDLARQLPEQVRRAAEEAAALVADRTAETARQVANSAAARRTASWQVRLGVTAAVLAAPRRAP